MMVVGKGTVVALAVPESVFLGPLPMVVVVVVRTTTTMAHPPCTRPWRDSLPWHGVTILVPDVFLLRCGRPLLFPFFEFVVWVANEPHTFFGRRILISGIRAGQLLKKHCWMQQWDFFDCFDCFDCIDCFDCFSVPFDAP